MATTMTLEEYRDMETRAVNWDSHSPAPSCGRHYLPEDCNNVHRVAPISKEAALALIQDRDMHNKGTRLYHVAYDAIYGVYKHDFHYFIVRIDRPTN